MKKNILKNCAFVACLSVFMVMLSCGGEPKNQSFTISGNVPAAVTAEWIYLYDLNSEEMTPVDSARIKDGAFELKGVAADTVRLVALHPGTLDEYPAVGWNVAIEPGHIVIDTNDQFASGTPVNDGLKDWMTAVTEIMYTAEGPEEIGYFFREHWSEHSQDFVGAYMLMAVSPFMEFGQVDTLAAQIPAEMRRYAMFEDFFSQLDAVRKMQPGCAFTDVDVTTLDGAAAKLSDYIGKGDYVLVDFWASWCGPCRQAMPQLQSVVKKHKTLKVIGIAVSDKVDDTRKAVGDLNISWPVLCDPEGLTAKTYGISAIPAMILFSPDGKIAARDFNVVELENILSEQMK